MQNVPKIVQSRLQRPEPVKFESHPDADLLTAFAEQSLAGRERDHVVEHLARCGDCREVVSIALPPQLKPQPSADISSNWFRWPVVRWAAVAAGVALIASFGILQYRGQDTKQLASNVFEKDTAIATPAQIPQASSPPTIPDVRRKKAGTKEAGLNEDKLVDRDGAYSSARRGSLRDVAPSPAARQNPYLAQDHRAAAAPSPAQTVEVQAETAQVTTPTAAQDQLQDQLQAQDRFVQNEPATQAAASAGPGEFVAKAKPASAQGFRLPLWHRRLRCAPSRFS